MKKIDFVCPYCTVWDSIPNAAQGSSFTMVEIACPSCSKSIRGRISFDSFIPVTLLPDGTYADVMAVQQDPAGVNCRIKPFCKDSYPSGINPFIQSYILDFRYKLSDKTFSRMESE
jgi:hypothetical protein